MKDFILKLETQQVLIICAMTLSYQWDYGLVLLAFA